MRFHTSAAFAILSIIPATLSAAPTGTISADAVKAHVAFLADDLLEGRDTGSKGHEIAARYVATQFAGMGLTPAARGDWYQRVPMVEVKPNSDAQFSIDGTAFSHLKDVVVSGAGPKGGERIEGKIIFGGFCLDRAEYGLSDLKGLNVKGKIVACLSGFPKGLPSDVGAHLNAEKSKVLSQRGAIGVISLRTLEREKQTPWTRVIEYADNRSVRWTNADGSLFDTSPNLRASATLDRSAADALFGGTKRSFADILAEADKKGGKPKPFDLGKQAIINRTATLTPFTSPNVIGMLPGSDPALANEYVLVMGHLDHIGIKPGVTTGDTINNGAMDNATGIATMLEAARAMAANPNRPKRPVLFAAVTGEEKGLLGADYLSRNPIIPAGRVAAVVNLDMPILTYDFTDVVAFGAEHSTLGPIVAAATAKDGVTLSPDPLPEEGLFTRSDHYRFVQRGIPSVFLMTGHAGPGAKAFNDFLKTNYHRVSDDMALPFNWNAAAKFARINMLIATEIANAPEVPKWYLDSFFGNVFAPSSPKAAR